MLCLPHIAGCYELGGSNAQVTNRQQGPQRITALLKRLSSTFESIDDRNHFPHFQPKRFHTFDGPERTAAGRDNILDNDDLLAFLNGPFHITSAAVPFRFFPHDETIDRQAALAGERDDGCGDRIGADRHPPHGIRDVLAQQIQNSLGDQVRSAAIERHLPAIEVVGGLFSRGQRELADLQRLFADQLDQSISVIHGISSPDAGGGIGLSHELVRRPTVWGLSGDAAHDEHRGSRHAQAGATKPRQAPRRRVRPG